MFINFLQIVYVYTIIGTAFFGHKCDLDTATTRCHHGGAAFDMKDIGAPSVSDGFGLIINI